MADLTANSLPINDLWQKDVKYHSCQTSMYTYCPAHFVFFHLGIDEHRYLSLLGWMKFKSFKLNSFLLYIFHYYIN